MKANYLLTFHNSSRNTRNFIFKKDNVSWLVSQAESWSLNYKLPYDIDIPNNSIFLVSYLKKILSVNRNKEDIRIAVEKENDEYYLFCYPKKIGVSLRKIKDFDLYYQDFFLKNIEFNNLNKEVGCFNDLDLRVFKIIFYRAIDTNFCLLGKDGLFYYLKDGYLKINVNSNLDINSEIPMGFFKALGESYFNSFVSHNYNHISKSYLMSEVLDKKLGIKDRYKIFIQNNFLVGKALDDEFYVISPLNLVKEKIKIEPISSFNEIIFESTYLFEVFKEFKNAFDSSSTILKFEFDSNSMSCKTEVINVANNYKFLITFPITKMDYTGKILLSLNRDFYMFLKNSALVGPIYFRFREGEFLEIVYQSKISSTVFIDMSIYTLL